MITIITGFQEVPCLQYAGHTLKTGYFLYPDFIFERKNREKLYLFLNFAECLLLLRQILILVKDFNVIDERGNYVFSEKREQSAVYRNSPQGRASVFNGDSYEDSGHVACCRNDGSGGI